MGISRQHVQGIINIYIEAWETRDPELICTIFTPDATYHERVISPPVISGHDGIRRYWETKVAGAQANIMCRPLSLYVDGSTAIVEWLAEFDDLAQGVRKRMREIAVLEFTWTMERGYLIASLREYWASETVAVLQAGAASGSHAL